VPSANATNKLEKIQVLVLDGSAHAADLLRDVFLKLGFMNIQVVSDGYEGAQAMKKKPVHLVITDWELRVRKKPKISDTSPPSDKDILPLSGTEFVRRLRQSPHSPNPFVPVVMVVNHDAEENAALARDAGVNEIITKPLQADELCARLMQLIDDRRHFITAENYKGPCRRRAANPLGEGVVERRQRQVRLVRRKEFRSS